jgi:hypothetical protein
MLRAEDSRQPNPGRLDQPIDDVAKRVIDGSVITDNSHSRAAQALRSDQNVGPEADRTYRSSYHPSIIECRG